MPLSGQSRPVPQLIHNLQWLKTDKWHKFYSDSFYSVRAIVSTHISTLLNSRIKRWQDVITIIINFIVQ